MPIPSQRPDTRPSDTYMSVFEDELSRQLASRRVREAADIVQNELVALLARGADVETRYPSARKYARVRFRAAVSNHTRDEKKQRGEGAHACFDDNGRILRGRIVVSGDVPLTDESSSSFFEVSPSDAPDAFDELVERHANQDLLRRALLGTSEEARHLIGLAYVIEHTDAEIARFFGCARETVNRKKQAAVRQIRGNLGPHAA
jgi:RNA polymerase sigma factor (sigma-70 family)